MLDNTDGTDHTDETDDWQVLGQGKGARPSFGANKKKIFLAFEGAPAG